MTRFPGFLADVERYGRRGTGEAERFLRGLDHLDAVEFLRTALERDPERIVGMALRHVNGFFRIGFPGSGGGSSPLVLHLWPAGTDGPITRSDAHNHRSLFTSRILVGELVHIFYRARANRSGDHFGYRHHQSQHGRGFHFESNGRWHLEASGQARLRTGEVYSLPPERVHRAQGATGLPTSTLLVELPATTTVTDVYVPRHRRPTGVKLHHEHPTADVLARQVSELADALHGRSPAGPPPAWPVPAGRAPVGPPSARGRDVGEGPGW